MAKTEWMVVLYKLKEKLLNSANIGETKATNFDIESFHRKYNLAIPDDLVEYFKTVNGSNGQCDENLFSFYSFDCFIRINDGLSSWNGIPDYTNIVNTLPCHENCFVFADVNFHLFSFAIRLYKHITPVNEVYSICGDEYRIIANSFSEFIEIYLLDYSKVEF